MSQSVQNSQSNSNKDSLNQNATREIHIAHHTGVIQSHSLTGHEPTTFGNMENAHPNELKKPQKNSVKIGLASSGQFPRSERLSRISVDTSDQMLLPTDEQVEPSKQWKSQASDNTLQTKGKGSANEFNIKLPQPTAYPDERSTKVLKEHQNSLAGPSKGHGQLIPMAKVLNSIKKTHSSTLIQQDDEAEAHQIEMLEKRRKQLLISFQNNSIINKENSKKGNSVFSKERDKIQNQDLNSHNSVLNSPIERAQQQSSLKDNSVEKVPASNTKKNQQINRQPNDIENKTERSEVNESLPLSGFFRRLSGHDSQIEGQLRRRHRVTMDMKSLEEINNLRFIQEQQGPGDSDSNHINYDRTSISQKQQNTFRRLSLLADKRPRQSLDINSLAQIMNKQFKSLSEMDGFSKEAIGQNEQIQSNLTTPLLSDTHILRGSHRKSNELLFEPPVSQEQAVCSQFIEEISHRLKVKAELKEELLKETAEVSNFLQNKLLRNEELRAKIARLEMELAKTTQKRQQAEKGVTVGLYEESNSFLNRIEATYGFIVRKYVVQRDQSHQNSAYYGEFIYKDFALKIEKKKHYSADFELSMASSLVKSIVKAKEVVDPKSFCRIVNNFFTFHAKTFHSLKEAILKVVSFIDTLNQLSIHLEYLSQSFELYDIQISINYDKIIFQVAFLPRKSIRVEVNLFNILSDRSVCAFDHPAAETPIVIGHSLTAVLASLVKAYV